MKLFSIEAGRFKLDGGAMFGVVPKSIWSKLYPSDQKNMIDIEKIIRDVSNNYWWSFY